MYGHRAVMGKVGQRVGRAGARAEPVQGDFKLDRRGRPSAGRGRIAAVDVALPAPTCQELRGVARIAEGSRDFPQHLPRPGGLQRQAGRERHAHGEAQREPVCGRCGRRPLCSSAPADGNGAKDKHALRYAVYAAAATQRWGKTRGWSGHLVQLRHPQVLIGATPCRQLWANGGHGASRLQGCAIRPGMCAALATARCMMSPFIAG